MELAARAFNSDRLVGDRRPARREAQLPPARQGDRAGRQVDARCTAVADVVRRMLQRRHNDVTDFEISVPELLLKQEQRTKTIFNIVLGAIASISLVVGGIGIMNIMLASILERIKEIGVRRAVGATQKDVLAQFLSEAVMISLAGGIAGIIVGGILSYGIERIAQHPHDRVGDVRGRRVRRVGRRRPRVRHRARRASAAKQDPIVCLRYE